MYTNKWVSRKYWSLGTAVRPRPRANPRYHDSRSERPFGGNTLVAGRGVQSRVSTLYRFLETSSFVPAPKTLQSTEKHTRSDAGLPFACPAIERKSPVIPLIPANSTCAYRQTITFLSYSTCEPLISRDLRRFPALPMFFSFTISRRKYLISAFFTLNGRFDRSSHNSCPFVFIRG